MADQTATHPDDTATLNRLRAYLDTYPPYPQDVQGDPEAMVVQRIRDILGQPASATATADLPTYTTVVAAWTAWMRRPDGYWRGTDGSLRTHTYIDQRITDDQARVILPAHTEHRP